VLGLVAAQAVALLAFASPANAVLPPPDDGNSPLNLKIVQIAKAEYANTARNHPSSLCNYYTGAMNGASSSCSTAGFGYGNWCADFAWWVFKQAGASLARKSSWADSFRQYPDGTTATSSTNPGVNGWVFHPSYYYDRTLYVPWPGQVVSFDWDPDSQLGGYRDATSDGSPDIDHVGIIISVDTTAKTFTTIEGNSGSPGWIRQKTYSYVETRAAYAYVQGYTTPLYA
jgi:hypothetical protein